MKKILIIEDDLRVARALKIRFESKGYETAIASDAILGANLALQARPDLIILDLGLPGIDGFDLLEHLGPMYVFLVPVIVVSGRELHRNKERALNAGAVEYLQKPWNDDELLEMIARYASDPSSSQMPPTGGAMEIALPNAA